MDVKSHSNDQPLITHQPHEKKRLDWRIFLILTFGAALVSLLSIPLGASQLHIVITWTVILEQFVSSLILAAIAAFIGLWFGNSLGLGAPMLHDWLAGNPEAPRQFRRALPLALVLGIAVGIAVVVPALLIGPLFGFDPLHTQTHPSPWLGFLASFDAPLREEVLFRLGIMTFLVWLGCKILHRDQPTPTILWSALIISALIFAASHWQNFPLPTFALIILAILTNFVPGLILGWLYWRKGLLLAIIAHFCGDIITHVLAPAILILILK